MEGVTIQEAILRLDEIDEDVVPHDELRQILGSFFLDPPVMRENDPFSADYRQGVLNLYEQIFGKPYDATDEGLDINTEHELAWGWPYGTQSGPTIGGFLIAYGFLIKTMNLVRGARVLEIGCGTGALTMHLAKSGYRVTSLEVNASNVELVNRMTAGYPVRPQVVLGDAAVFQTDERYDVIIFFESLHHFIEHEEFLRRCISWLTDDGMIAFCAEPIVSEDSSHLAYPWGLRLDGESLRAMHKFGWIELGFRQSYFDQLMERVGLIPSSIKRDSCRDSQAAKSLNH